ncbi:2Fe-2S iron-sulfur cluster-binding protein [Bradyrhizobium sp. CCBAU 51627]|uniref:2Fe-2S iron-sulfur cluster-binding protein n=1 Tax=Bradyrhizobium sp. CCBAU 51627 TaxID=1325088 RepID=UPI002306976C|nr:2Fe-2S iron-sulfur cluster-binding protein [Bradyrhizobium sp. CCBAU 51627]MDA9433765.1 2Fe-2S ferredoxin [Bradyrhizobium sp. CCBAU 51627]
MPQITYVEHDGKQHTLDISSGLSVMEGAVKNGVPGIDADCGGACACATCHVYVDAGWLGVLPPKSPIEKQMLECASNTASNSRLSCQIKVTVALDGLRVSLPESQ